MAVCPQLIHVLYVLLNLYKISIFAFVLIFGDALLKKKRKGALMLPLKRQTYPPLKILFCSNYTCDNDDSGEYDSKIQVVIWGFLKGQCLE